MEFLCRPASTSSTPSEVRLPSLNLASKLRAPSSRSEHDQQGPTKAPETAQRNASIRPPLRRTAIVNQPSANNLAKPPVRPSLSLRGKLRSRESVAPWGQSNYIVLFGDGTSEVRSSKILLSDVHIIHKLSFKQRVLFAFSNTHRGSPIVLNKHYYTVLLYLHWEKSMLCQL